MLYRAEVTGYSEIDTEHINTVWAECTMLNVKRISTKNNQ